MSYLSKDDRDYAKALIKYMSIIQEVNLRRKKRNLPPVDVGHDYPGYDKGASGAKVPNVQRHRQVKRRVTAGGAVRILKREERIKNIENVIQRPKKRRKGADSQRGIVIIELTDIDED